jgi:hypothetical protein
MDALEFFRLITPEYGIHYLACFKVGYKIPTHAAYTDLATMVADARQFARSSELQVYHACASYLKPCIELEDGKKKYRVDDNWDRARSFWIDIDCGQEKFDAGKGYLTKRDATQAIFGFCDTIGWPKPLVVSSGNGIHAYWPLTKDIKSEAWVAVATILKATLAHQKVLADPSRTSDFASILRTPETFNRKNGERKEVRVLVSGSVTDPSELAVALQRFVKENGVPLLREVKKKSLNRSRNADMLAGMFPVMQSSLDEAANKCAQLGAFRDSQGSGNYEVFRGVVGVAKFCSDGEALMPLWVEKRMEGHDQDDWQNKWESWNKDPTSCGHFIRNNPVTCEGCEFKGKIKGPIALGRIIPISVETIEEVTTEEGELTTTVIPPLPNGYQWDGNLMARLLPDKDGVMHPLAFSYNLFYPTSRIKSEDGTFRYGIRLHLPDKRIRDFEIPGDSVASNTDMLRAMAKYELTQSNHKDAGNHMAAYLRDQLQALKTQVEEVSTMTAYGWKNDQTAFLLGDTLYGCDGTERRVLLGGSAKHFAKNFTPKGSLQKYSSALNFLYNRKQSEMYQYIICAGWGSLLTPLCEDLYKGLLLAIQGGKTGQGKTTACHAAMYAFGYAPRMTLNSKDGATHNALYAFLGAFNNLPILFDELTNMEPQLFSDLAYGVSNGKEKERLQSRGGTVGFANSSEWGCSPYVTGNRDFHGLLAATQANSQAEAVRLIQINADRFPRVPLLESAVEEHSLVADAMKTMQENSGMAGAAMVKYVVTNYKTVMNELRQVAMDMSEVLPDAKYRFYRAHSACTLVMARIAKDLGIVEFDLDGMKAFTYTLVGDLANTVMITNSVTEEEAFNRMMSSVASRILVTNEYRDKRDGRGPESPRNRIIGEIAGRYILGSNNEKILAGNMAISQKEIRDWCIKNRYDYNVMLDKLDKDGVLLKKGEKFTLTRGTDYPTVQQRCIVVDMHKLDIDGVVSTLTLVANEVDRETAVGL